MIRLALALALLALPVAAEEAPLLPALTHVTGVAAGDVLNVRAAPSAGAAVLGSIPPGTEGVEVLEISADGKWALVPLPEGAGWAARRYLSPMPFDPARMPRPMRCHGTEPFWALQIDEFGGQWATPEAGAHRIALPQAEAAAEGWLALIEDPEAGHSLTALITREICSDGMSDRRHGLRAQIFDRDLRRGQNRIWQGCCTLDRR